MTELSLPEIISHWIQKAEVTEVSPVDQKNMLWKILGILDLTTLDGTDHSNSVSALCHKALSFGEKGLPLPAAVCVYPPFIALCKKLLNASGIKVASVAGAFPSGQLPIHLKTAEVRYAVEQGADEIDMVISRGTFLIGDANTVRNEIIAIKEACGKAHLKVILETGELKTPENIYMASMLAMEAGADFIKTSTGKIQPAATPEAMVTMLLAIRKVFEETGKRIGIKPAGGISAPDQAIMYWLLVKNILGEAWLNPDLFRIGASRLADGIVAELDQ